MHLGTETVLCDLDALTDQALQEIRTTSYLLHPPLLDEIGFIAAAEWYVEGFAKRTGINAHLDLPEQEERMPLEIETALFRVLQESLTNVHRYSGSSEVNVRFERGEEAAILEVADRGIGIPEVVLKRLGDSCAGAGVGLPGMRERMQELNGNLEINSDNSGTRLRATVPLVDLPNLVPAFAPGLVTAGPEHNLAN
jgi:signal transduction histidine kinase